jgi:hypothetical protein
MVPVEQEAPGR